MISRLRPAYIYDHIKYSRTACDCLTGLGHFGLRCVTTQREPDWDTNTNPRACNSSYRFIYVARRDKNHGETKLLRFLAQSQNIRFCRIWPENRVVYEIR